VLQLPNVFGEFVTFESLNERQAIVIKVVVEYA